MQTFQLDGNRDLFTKNGIIQTETDKNALLNLSECVGYSIRNEMLFNYGGGLPYFQTIFKSASLLPFWKHFYIKRLLQIQQIIDITDFTTQMQMTDSGNTLQYTLQMTTDFGQADIDNAILLQQ